MIGRLQDDVAVHNLFHMIMVIISITKAVAAMKTSFMIMTTPGVQAN